MELLRIYESDSDEDNISMPTDDTLGRRDSRSVYLLTYSQVDLDKMPSRLQFAEAVVKSFQTTSSTTQVLHWCCSEETHLNGGLHYHMSLKLSSVRRWLGSKRYLLDRHGISVHFSDIHHNYYSAWRYVTKSDTQYLQSTEHPDLSNAQEPVTAAASRARRKPRKRKHDDDCESDNDSGSKKVSEQDDELVNHNRKKKQKKRMTTFEVSELIQSRKISTTTELHAFAQQQKVHGKTDLAQFILNRTPRALADILNTSWDMFNAQEKLNRSKKTRAELLADALHSDCICENNGDWKRCAEEVLANNNIPKIAFVGAVRDLLIRGRGKFRNVLIIGPANCGKTFYSQSLNVIYRTFCNPASGRFAWVGVDDAECVIFLNDFRWNSEMIPWHDLLLLLEGQEVHLAAPKTHFAKDIHLTKDTPIFATSKHELIYIKNGVIDTRETEMMRVRWRLFSFTHQISEQGQRDLLSCKRCFAELISQY